MPWIIDKDHFAYNGHTEVGTRGPSTYDGDGTELTHKFRMLDDDRELVYEGRSHDDSSFAPLDDFGKPNFGCTIIQYWVSGKGWQDL